MSGVELNLTNIQDSLFSGKMGKGEIVQSITSTTQFTPIVPDALEESAFKKVCNK